MHCLPSCVPSSGFSSLLRFCINSISLPKYDPIPSRRFQRDGFRRRLYSPFPRCRAFRGLLPRLSELWVQLGMPSLRFRCRRVSEPVFQGIAYCYEDRSGAARPSHCGGKAVDPPRTAAARETSARDGAAIRRTFVRLRRQLPLLSRGYLYTPRRNPCRHPELVRPSLEACGFDIGRTTSELFGIELKWGADGKMPEYLTLVCGFFHDGDGVVW